MKADRLAERLKDVLSGMEVEPLVSIQNPAPAAWPASPAPERFTLSAPPYPSQTAPALEISVELSLPAPQTGRLAAGVPRSDPRFPAAEHLAAAAAQLLSARLAELQAHPGRPLSPAIHHRPALAFASGQLLPADSPADPPHLLRQPINLGGAPAGRLLAQAGAQHSSLLAAVGGLLAQRLERLELQARLERTEVEAAALRTRLAQLSEE